MARLSADNIEVPKVKVTFDLNPMPGVIVLALAFLGQISVLSDLYPVRLGSVLVVLGVAFLAGSRFGRAEQARELLRRD